MDDCDVAFMEDFKEGELEITPGTPLVLQGGHSPQLYTVLKGLGLRYVTLSDGRRQVVNFVMPGDFIGLQAGIGEEMGHSVEATTNMTLCVFERSQMWRVFREHPPRAYDITWLAAAEEHFLGDALASVGQRSAIERICWALALLYDRFDALDLVENGCFDFPYRQQDLADTLGLSLVHTNKTLARMRERDLAAWVGNRVVIRDLAALRRIAVMPEGEFRQRPLL